MRKCRIAAAVLAFATSLASTPVSSYAAHSPRATLETKIAEGKKIFRYDTFGDQQFWGGKLKLHQAIEGQKLGGMGPGLTPLTALALGLKVDVDALPRSLVSKLKQGRGWLASSLTTHSRPSALPVPCATPPSITP